MKVILSAILLAVASPVVAENTWNILTSDVADEASRQAASELLAGTIFVFEALRSAEQREYETSSSQLQAARDQFQAAAVLLEGLANLEEAQISLNTDTLSDLDVIGLLNWYSEYSDAPFAAVQTVRSPFQNGDFTTVSADLARSVVSDLRASDLLLVAALHCRALAQILTPSDNEEAVQIAETRLVPPSTLAILTSQSALIISIGNIATEAFGPPM